MTIFTIGHSNQPLEPFLDALAAHRIELIADVRRFPASRRHPHFGQARLAESLAASGVAYRHFPDLGGRRTPRPDSRNTAWREVGFRGYADYMETAPFAEALAHLMDEASVRRTAVMCAELLWRSCHRGLIADCMKASGHDVLHIISATRSEPHPFTSAARIVNGELTYAGLI